MERKIGEIFEYNGEWYQCVKSPDGSCKHCDMNFGGKCPIPINECVASSRSDLSYVIFKKLEKVGGPVIRARRSKGANNFGWFPYAGFQKYKVSFPVILPEEPFTHLDEDKGIVYIELKENKEDMEEKKQKWGVSSDTINEINKGIEPMNTSRNIDAEHSGIEGIRRNLKPFNLEAAKQGKPVCTRDGRKARIICFDRRLFYKNVSYPILALVECSDGEDDVCGYNEKGKVLIEDDAGYKDDLMMLPEKKEGWVNVYKGGLLDTKSYPTKKEAFDKACPEGYVDTVKVCWEE